MSKHFPRLIFGLLFAALLSAPASAQQGLNLFGPGAKLIYHSTAELRPLQKRGLRWLRGDMQYFGAMAIVPGSGVYAVYRGFHSWRIAVTIALFHCRMEALRAGEDPKACVWYASVVPRSLDVDKAVAKGVRGLPYGLGQNAYKAFVGDYERRQRPNTYGAFAISGFAQDGYSYGFSNAVDAADRAKAQCEASMAKALVPYPREIRDLFREKGLDRCWVVHIHKP